MKKFDKIIQQLLKEAPIVNVDVMGGIDDDGFDKASIKFINNPKFASLITSGWAKSHANFDIKFLGGGASKWVEYGIVTKDELETKLGLDDFVPNPNTITVFFTNNKGAELKPITPWIAAHRFGHSLRAGVGRDSELRTLIHRLEDSFLNLVNTYLHAYGLKEFHSERINQFINSIGIPESLTREIVNRIGTMRSARQNNIDRPFEFFYEIIAQHITSGGVIFNRHPSPIEHEGDTYEFKINDGINNFEKNIALLEQQFNNGIKNLFNYSVGRSFIM